MRKTKTQKIIYTAAIIILAIALVALLLSKFGIVDFKKEINRAVNSDFYWQSEPFGELKAVWYVESMVEKMGDDYNVVSKLCNENESEKFSDSSLISFKKLKNLKYRDISSLYDLYFYKGIRYAAMFVPDDCAYVEINGERFDTQSGKINTPEGEIEFKYFTAAYKSNYSSEKPGVDKFVLYSEKGKAYEKTENWED